MDLPCYEKTSRHLHTYNRRALGSPPEASAHHFTASPGAPRGYPSPSVLIPLAACYSSRFDVFHSELLDLNSLMSPEGVPGLLVESAPRDESRSGDFAAVAVASRSK